MKRWLPGLLALVLLLLAGGAAQARLLRIEVARTEPAFGGQKFGEVGEYERVFGRAYGEVDPTAPANAGIQDIALAPRNARGMVEYSTDIEILRPLEFERGNQVILFNVLNRGNKGALPLFNADVPNVAAANNNLATPAMAG